jgi:hypothetical protein
MTPSKLNHLRQDRMAVCAVCRFDLEVRPERRDGEVYCSNHNCEHATRPHPMTHGVCD